MNKAKLFVCVLLLASIFISVIYLTFIAFVVYLVSGYDLERWSSPFWLIYWFSIIMPILIVGFTIAMLYKKTYQQLLVVRADKINR